jgi:hypothetical protein
LKFFSPGITEADESVTEIVRPKKKKSLNAKKPEEKKYNIEEVKEIVARALREQEEQLREEYNQILSDRLQGFFLNYPFNSQFILLFLIPLRRTISRFRSVQRGLHLSPNQRKRLQLYVMRRGWVIYLFIQNLCEERTNILQPEPARRIGVK